jgi:hypothetical protein
MKTIIEYEEIDAENLPRDPSFTSKGWTIEPVEHNEMTFPRALKVTDAEGRSYTYLAVGPDWRAVRITNIGRDS